MLDVTASAGPVTKTRETTPKSKNDKNTFGRKLTMKDEKDKKFVEGAQKFGFLGANRFVNDPKPRRATFHTK
jgi:hypothetical protein